MQHENRNGYENEWPDSLDAMAAAPEHHRIIFENENVRVLDTRIRPGESVQVHTHRWPSIVYTLETSEFVRFDTVDKIFLDSRVTPLEIKTETAISLPPLRPHAIENVGTKEMRAITVELKDHSSGQTL